MAILAVKTKVKKSKSKKIAKAQPKQFTRFAKVAFWFISGVLLGFIFLISFLYTAYRTNHTNKVYDGIVINGNDFGGKTKEEVRKYFTQKNQVFKNTLITLKTEQAIATISAEQIAYGYDENLIAQQAYSVGRSNDILSNMSITLQAYISGVHLTAPYHYQEDKLNRLLAPLSDQIDIKPVNAQFDFDGKRVVAFKLSSNGRAVDNKKLKKDILTKLQTVSNSDKSAAIILTIPVKVVDPEITTEKVNKLGIKELIGEGTSLFQHSIENRIFNVNLAATRINGALIKPGEMFSFVKTVGDINSLSGYKQAYVIENGKTVLGDGGGVCQVSTTLFRAALNAGLPIAERNQHAYRVGYYEEDSPPGVDAAIYSPSVDLKFKNDTGHSILIQTIADLNELRLTFQLFGTKDDREVTINKPIILSQSPAPEAEYHDDPTLPKGQVKQIDFSAGGANVYFTRIVKKGGKVIAQDKFVSNYRPWKAIYLRGTKE